jgi:hypothetical protein
MLFDIDALVSRARSVGLTLCGIIMAGTPVFLWVAWSETVFFVAIMGCLLAVLFLGVCLGPDPPPDSNSEREY